MITLDKIKIVSSVNNISNIKYDKFQSIIENGTIIEQKITIQTPYLVFIEADYQERELIIEFTGKILNVIVGNDVESIGEYAFSNCPYLSEVTITDAVSFIGEGAFSDCSKIKSVTIGNTVKTIAYEAFINCSSLVNLTIGYRVADIGLFAFKNCSSLTSVTIPDMVKIVPQGIFNGCTSLISATIGEGVTEVRTGAFSGCTKLESVTIGSNVSSLDQAFTTCSSLKYIYCKPVSPPAIYYSYGRDSGTFPLNYGMKIYVPRSAIALYTAYDEYDYQTNKIAKGNWWRYKSYVQAYDF